jgi:MoaA/NifB/PqqE/SkfB family radical SAM enzyme
LFEFFQRQHFKHVVFYYHGGEATRHNRIVEVLAHVKAKSAECGIYAYNEMQTNLTMKGETLRAIVPYCDMFNVSFHYLELKKRGYKLDAFNRNWDILKELNVNVHNMDVMLEYIEPQELDLFYQLVEGYLEYSNITNSEMVYCFGYNFTHNKETITQHERFYRKYNKTEQTYDIDGKIYTTNDMFNVGLDCTGWWCSAGTKSITINGDGNVYNCGIHMTNNLRGHPDAAFTNLVSDPMAVTKMALLQKIGTKCRWDYCGGDFYLEKRKLNA